MAQTEQFLLVEDLTAGYRGKPIVSEISIYLNSGDILGLLGANGSGKSTLLKAVTGQIRPMNGSIHIFGIDIALRPEDAKLNFGFAIDGFDLPSSLTGKQYLALVASIRGCRADEWPCGNVVDRLFLGTWIDRQIAEYSLGTRAKLSIAAALLGAPALLIFDESLNGLDPIIAWEAKTILSELAATGKHAIIISTHVVELVPGLCNRAVFLADGRIVREWNHDSLREASQAPRMFENCIIQTLKKFREVPSQA